jgi:hypothetical protein
MAYLTGRAVAYSVFPRRVRPDGPRLTAMRRCRGQLGDRRR